jgi:hypothetical protein
LTLAIYRRTFALTSGIGLLEEITRPDIEPEKV